MQRRSIALLAGVLAAGALAGAAEPGGPGERAVPPDDASCEYVGAWQRRERDTWTIYPGSQMRFALRGRARLALRSGLPATLRVDVRRAGQVVWDERVDQADVALDGGTSAVPFTVTFLCAAADGFDASRPDAAGAELHVLGLTLQGDAALSQPPPLRQARIEFVGDSIAGGVVILGREGTWERNSNVALTYGFLVGEKLQVPCRIRAYPGSGCAGIAGRYRFFRSGIPLDTNAPPDMVVVNTGANDREQEAVSYREQMRALVDTILGMYPAARVVLLNFCRMTPNRLPALRELARGYPGGRVSAFDARPYLVGYSDEGVHPDVESHRRLAEALAAYIAPLLQPGAGNPQPARPPNALAAEVAR